MGKQSNNRRRNNLILFSLNIVYIFVLGLFDGQFDMHYMYFALISIIYIASIFTINDSGTKIISAPIILIILTWLGELLHMPTLGQLSGILATLFFLYVIILLVKRVASSKTVGALEFLESVNVYLLLGIAGSLLFNALYSNNATSFHYAGEILKNHSDFIYFSFVTLTTLGYGDITPVDNLARSLSIFFSVSGQLYLTMIIAMLVGKYITQQTEKN
jgi:voltage-gated potassium channel